MCRVTGYEFVTWIVMENKSYSQNTERRKAGNDGNRRNDIRKEVKVSVCGSAGKKKAKVRTLARLQLVAIRNRFRYFALFLASHV